LLLLLLMMMMMMLWMDATSPIGYLSCQPKVKEFDFATNIKTNVVWFEVTVDDSFGVQVRQRAGDIAHHLETSREEQFLKTLFFVLRERSR